ncbi:MAG TPA: FAD-dependent monooxygenase [Xanthobacteraceae bacterium]|nr:FAD-dependent monooxygenase [Xanthobacteraceae bacterium]
MKPKIAIIGAGMGGLTVAATLLRAGFDAEVYEQASRFTRLGAGIQMSPNAIKVLRTFDLEKDMRKIAFRPPGQFSREWNTGEILLKVPFGDTVEARYGAPYLLMHRGDLHLLLARCVPEARIHLSKKLVDIDDRGNGVGLRFADGTTAEADVVIGADGVHSTVRTWMLGAEKPTYTGRVAYRTTFPAALLNGYEIDDCTKWWGPDRHIVIYYITRERDEVYFVTSVPEPEWTEESWSMKGDLGELRRAFEGFHPQVKAVLDACPDVHKWAINVREPLPQWSKGGVVLLGDACHPMTPYMAQGAATSMEDAMVLTRCLLEIDSKAEIGSAFSRYERTRKARTSKIQFHSHENKWLHRNADTDWVYGYDAVTVPLAAKTEVSDSAA